MHVDVYVYIYTYIWVSPRAWWRKSSLLTAARNSSSGSRISTGPSTMRTPDDPHIVTRQGADVMLMLRLTLMERLMESHIIHIKRIKLNAINTS